jgi:hypothetical protein
MTYDAPYAIGKYTFKNDLGLYDYTSITIIDTIILTNYTNDAYYYLSGKYTFNNDLGLYEGTWELGKYNGQGVRLYANGSKYVGSFREGRIEGNYTI